MSDHKCSKIISRSASGDNYVIEGNRRVWYTEDGKRWRECDPQYTGPVGDLTSDGQICDHGRYLGSGLGSIFR